MSHDTADRVEVATESDTLRAVHRRLGAIHVTLAEADRIDEGLHRRTLDRLMDVLEMIEGASERPPREQTMDNIERCRAERERPAAP